MRVWEALGSAGTPPGQAHGTSPVLCMEGTWTPWVTEGRGCFNKAEDVASGEVGEPFTNNTNLSKKELHFISGHGCIFTVENVERAPKHNPSRQFPGSISLNARRLRTSGANLSSPGSCRRSPQASKQCSPISFPMFLKPGLL